MKVAILTLGSQGDIRPFVALSLALQAEKHYVIIATNPENEKYCQQHGIPFCALEGDLAACIKKNRDEQPNLGKIKVVRTLIRSSFEALREQFKSLNRLLHNMDAVFYHPGVFTARHVIEARKIPSIGIYFQPEIPSKYYSCCLLPPNLPLKKWSNLAGHYVIAQLFWTPFRKIINEWRANNGLTKLGVLAPLSYPPFKAVPIVIAASSELIPPAPDWPSNAHVAGFLQLSQSDWVPSPSLLKYLRSGPPPMYVGFGSLTENCDEKMSDVLIKTLEKLPERVLLCGPFKHINKNSLPPNIEFIESAPHAWLFPQMKAIVHHGGAGTTHAALMAGKPTLAIPFIVDQFHWGEKIHEMNVGPKPLPASQFTEEGFSRSLDELLNILSYALFAKALSEKMQQENSAKKIIQIFHEHCAHFTPVRATPTSNQFYKRAFAITAAVLVIFASFVNWRG
ncbi:MAG TPA: glycosyltransferase [Chlamydiales bacterium]|jgi:UDP:flavonoid glycosyltransferase YjiC (YdhE family)|nr:glycosyltransferase [Chlamydiales bacterium]